MFYAALRSCSDAGYRGHILREVLQGWSRPRESGYWSQYMKSAAEIEAEETRKRMSDDPVAALTKYEEKQRMFAAATKAKKRAGDCVAAALDRKKKPDDRMAVARAEQKEAEDKLAAAMLEQKLVEERVATSARERTVADSNVDAALLSFYKKTMNEKAAEGSGVNAALLAFYEKAIGGGSGVDVDVTASLLAFYEQTTTKEKTDVAAPAPTTYKSAPAVLDCDSEEREGKIVDCHPLDVRSI